MDFSIQTIYFWDLVWSFLAFLGVVVGSCLVIFAVFLIARKFFSSPRFLPEKFKKKVFRLSIPYQSLDSESNQKELKQILAGIENFYANLGGLRADRGPKTWLFGRYDNWSFEIVLDAEGLITFFVVVPEYLKDYFQQQILSQYPFCQIEEIPDYNIFGVRGFAAAGFLKLLKNQMFPIMTYRQMDSDPLTALITTLSKLPKGQRAAIQFVMRSARKEWRRRGVKIASEMQQGKSFKEASGQSGFLSFLGGPGEWFSGQSRRENQPEKELHRLSPMEEEMVKSIEQKASRAGLDVNIRLVVFAPLESQAKDSLRQLGGSFAQYSNYEYANGFKLVMKGSVKRIVKNFIHRFYNPKVGFVLNVEEVASLWHLPLSGTEVPKIRWLQARRLPPPVDMPEQGLILGENLYRDQKTLVRIKDNDRRRHLYLIGMTGTGKSWLMANLAIQDIKAGKGTAVVDPHGSLVEDIMAYIPEERLDDVVYFNPADLERPIGLNMLEAATPQEMDFAVQEMINIFYKLLPDPAMAGPMFEHYMRNALLALIADPDNPGTLVELPRIFTDEKFRQKKLEKVNDILVKDFWEREYPASQKGSTAADMLSYVISKIGRFVENEMMRNIIGQSRSGFNFRKIMDQGKILLINLSKGQVGETNSNLLGLIAVSKLQMAAMARAELPESQRRDFYLYIDEFQNFITDSVSIILAEARKYRLNLIVAHQYINQLTQNNDSRIRDAVFGNIGSLVSFRIGVDDSETIAKQFAPKVTEYDVMNIEKFNCYVRLLIDNAAGNAFNMRCFPLPKGGQTDRVAEVKRLVREKYGRPKLEVVNSIIERSQIKSFKKGFDPE